IDWGNAVFLEGDEVTPQGISRQTDVYQVGELLYFIVTGGQRLALAGEAVDFGADEGRLSTRFKHIVQRATQPDLDRRYPSITALRQELAEYRRPLERDRDQALERILRRVKRQRSQRELENLLGDVKAVQLRDSGYPPARELRQQIEAELQRLAVLSDLDAARIYLESANWSRAIALLEEVAAQASDAERARALIVLDTARLTQAQGLSPVPAGFPAAVDALFADDPARAAHVALVTPESRPAARDLQWLLAERIQAYMPSVVVLRPHLVRLRFELAERPAFDDALDVVERALILLDQTGSGNLNEVAEAYRRTADAMLGLIAELKAAGAGDDVSGPVEAAGRAADAAGLIVERLQHAGAQATADPGAARAALEAAQVLDPVSPVFAALQTRIDTLQRVLTRLAEHRPLADGSDLGAWFGMAVADLSTFSADVPDPRLGMMIGGLNAASRAWQVFLDVTVVGNRRGAVDALQQAAEAVRALNPTLAGWFSNVRNVVAKARYPQRHALNAPFGRAMADGWSAWDRGSGIEAERLGRQALEESVTEAEKHAADRLIRLSRLLRQWRDGHGEGDPDLTARLDEELLTLFTEAETRHWQTFTEQMPSASAYLKAMASGLVQHFEETGTAALRVLFLHYVLRGVLEMYDTGPDDAQFWQRAALQTLPNAKNHVALLALANVIRDRQQIVKVAEQVNAVQSPADLSRLRGTVERSPLHLVLKPLLDAIASIEQALPQWGDGAFEVAGGLLEESLGKIEAAERLAHVRLDRFRTWLTRLHQVAADLNVTIQRIREASTSEQELPHPRLAEWHQKLVDDTAAFIGSEYTRDFIAWRDAFTAMLTIYTDDTRRRSRKLHDMDGLLNTAGIDMHPAYPAYRFWRGVIDARPEYPAPPTDEPVPRYAEEAAPPPAAPGAPRDATAEPDRPRPRLRLTRRRILWGGALLLVILVGAAAVLLLSGTGGGPGNLDVTWQSETPTWSTQQYAAATIGALQTGTAIALSATDTLTATPGPSVIPSEGPTASPTATRTAFPTLPPGGDLPTISVLTLFPESAGSVTPGAGVAEVGPGEPTATATEMLTPSSTPTETATATQSPVPFTTPVEPLRGDQHVLLALERYGQVYPWPESWFQPGELSGSWQLGLPAVGSDAGLLQVVLPADLLGQLFGTDAAIRARRIEANFMLFAYDPELVEEERVYFGLGLQGTNESRVAVQVQMVRDDAINVGVRAGDEFRAQTQLPLTDLRVNLALERFDDGTVNLLFNDEPLGAPRFLTAPNAPMMPFLFVQQGGVVVTVTDLILTLD
ncbi:MAG: hypothetical protein JW910_21725, partial [Anaerolineae bacterium]|nr:hypothetical protein [Anaerolineae bacterium]